MNVGSIQRPFLVVSDSTQRTTLDATGGTSFATPSVLRLGAGIRAHFGSNLDMLAIRALLVHRAEKSDLPAKEVGWGRVARDLESIVICDDDTIRVVYQGTISPSKYIRTPIPMPQENITGNVEITATICYNHEPIRIIRAITPEPALRSHSVLMIRSARMVASFTLIQRAFLDRLIAA